MAGSRASKRELEHRANCRRVMRPDGNPGPVLAGQFWASSTR